MHHNNNTTLPFSCVFWNCHNLNQRIDSIRMLIHQQLEKQQPLSLFAICETRWDPTKSLPSIHQYTWYHQHHLPNSGGLACLVHDSVAASWIDSDHPSLSALVSLSHIASDPDDSSAMAWMELKPNGFDHSLLIALIYLRPPVNDTILNKVHKAIERAQQLIDDRQSMILLGDFNLRHPFWDASIHQSDNQSSSFLSFLDSNHLSIVNNVFFPHRMPTRPASNSSLDLIIANNVALSHLSSMHIGVNGLVSDHHALLIRYCSNPSISLPPSCPIPRIDWKLDRMKSKEDWQLFEYELNKQLMLHYPYHPAAAADEHEQSSSTHDQHRSNIQHRYDIFLYCVCLNRSFRSFCLAVLFPSLPSFHSIPFLHSIPFDQLHLFIHTNQMNQQHSSFHSM